MSDERRPLPPRLDPLVDSAAWTHPLDTLESERGTGDGFDPQARWWVRRRKLLLWSVGILAIVGGLAGAGAWMALGLQDSAATLKSSASAAQDELTAFRDTARTDPTAARSHLEAASLHLTAAHAAADTRQVRIAGGIPYAKIPVSDLRHLLTAADLSVEAGRDALDVVNVIEPKTTTTAGAQALYADGQFNLPLLATATTKAQHIRELMLQAETELLAVDGTGVKEQEVPGIRDKALTQAQDLRRQMERAIPLLQLLPPMLGSQKPQTYLLTIMNQAEMHGSGGAPLAVGTVGVDKGKITIGPTQTTSDIKWLNALKQPTARGNANPSIPWKPVAGDPFWAKGKYSDGKVAAPFVTANNNPDFRVAGVSMARAWQGGTGQAVDGVIALDIAAVRQLLAVTGPVTAPGYGEVNAGNVAQLLLADVYATADSPGRHAINNALLGAVVQRLSDGTGLVDKVKALAAAAPGRHVQVWMRDAKVQKTAVENKFGGVIANPSTGDHIAVYAQNGGTSKVDALQVRTIDEVIRLKADGSADVQRTVTQRNTAADRVPGSLRSEQTGWVRTGLIHLLPKGSRVTKQPTNDPTLGSAASLAAKRSGAASAPRASVDQLKRPFWSQTVQIAPGGVFAQVLGFSVPTMAVPTDTGLQLSVTYDPDNALNVTKTRTVVIPPAGYRVSATPGVQVLAGQGVLDVALNAPSTVSVTLVRG